MLSEFTGFNRVLVNKFFIILAIDPIRILAMIFRIQQYINNQ